MNMEVQADAVKFNKDKFLKVMHEQVRQAFIKGAQQFLLAAVPRIPVYTGFSRGAFRNLEDLAGKVTKDAQSGGYRIRTTRSAGGRRAGGNAEQVAKGIPERHRWYYPPGGGRVYKTNQSGREFATPTSDILPGSVASIARGRGQIIFKFAVNITYVDSLDQAKWGAFKAGEAAMLAYLTKAFSNLDFGNVDFTTTSRIGRGG